MTPTITRGRGLWAPLALLSVLWPLAIGCGSRTHEGGGTDGNTHWLQRCDSDGECGALSCVCGACTRGCDADSACADLDRAASCQATALACETGATSMACVLECDAAEDCPQSASSCQGGRCVDDVDPQPREQCVAMDARPSGDECGHLEGFAFDGTECSPIYCGCLGQACESLYPSRRACLSDYAHCADEGPYAYCERDADCGASERCFAGTCGPSCDDYTQCEGETRCFADEPESCLPYVLDVGSQQRGPCLPRCRNDEDCIAVAPGLSCWGSACVRVPPPCELACPKVASECPAEVCVSISGAAYDPALMCRAADFEVLGCVPTGRGFNSMAACAVSPDGKLYGLSGTAAAHLIFWGGYTECSQAQFDAHSGAQVCAQ